MLCGPHAELFGKQSPIGVGAAAGRKGRSPAVVHVEGSHNTGGVLTLVDGARRSTLTTRKFFRGDLLWSVVHGGPTCTSTAPV